MRVLSIVVLPLLAVTFHRSFRSRDINIGGGAGFSVPVETRIAQAIDEGDEKDAQRTKVVIGKVTSAEDGNTIHVVTDGNVLFKVRLAHIATPAKGQPGGKQATEHLSKLIRGRTVRVEYIDRIRGGLLLGTVYLGGNDVNLRLLATGYAHYLAYDGEDADYVKAEATARQMKLGLWAEN